MQIFAKLQEMRWPDRAAMIATAAIFVTVALTLFIITMAVGSVSYLRFNIALLTWGFGSAFTLSAMIWLLLHGIDAAMRSAAQAWNQSLRPALLHARHSMDNNHSHNRHNQWHSVSLTH